MDFIEFRDALETIDKEHGTGFDRFIVGSGWGRFWRLIEHLTCINATYQPTKSSQYIFICDAIRHNPKELYDDLELLIKLEML